MINSKKVILRGLSLFLIIFSIIFGITWRKSGYCIGDNFLTGLGLVAWSDGTQGMHYSAVISLALMLVAFWLYSSTRSINRSVSEKT